MKNFEVGNNHNFLEGIQDEMGSRGTDRLLRAFIDKGIINVLKKQEQKQQLNQQEMQLLKDFRDAFPSITLEEILKFKEENSKQEQASNNFSWLDGIEED